MTYVKKEPPQLTWGSVIVTTPSSQDDNTKTTDYNWSSHLRNVLLICGAAYHIYTLFQYNKHKKQIVELQRGITMLNLSDTSTQHRFNRLETVSRCEYTKF